MTAQELFDGLGPELARVAHEEFCRIFEVDSDSCLPPLNVDLRKQPYVAMRAFSAVLLTVFGRFHGMYDAPLLSACMMSSVDMMLISFGPDAQTKLVFATRIGEYMVMIGNMKTLSDEKFNELLERTAETHH